MLALDQRTTELLPRRQAKIECDATEPPPEHLYIPYTSRNFLMKYSVATLRNTKNYT
jgi:hypothetical protein